MCLINLKLLDGNNAWFTSEGSFKSTNDISEGGFSLKRKEQIFFLFTPQEWHLEFPFCFVGYLKFSHLVCLIIITKEARGLSKLMALSLFHFLKSQSNGKKIHTCWLLMRLHAALHQFKFILWYQYCPAASNFRVSCFRGNTLIDSYEEKKHPVSSVIDDEFFYITHSMSMFSSSFLFLSVY